MEKAGKWLENALLDLCKRNAQTGIDLDADIISGLVSYCQLAPPLDAKEYLDNIIGQEASGVIEEYLKRRGDSEIYRGVQDTPTSKLYAYVKPPSNDGQVSGSRKPQRAPKEVAASTGGANQTASRNVQNVNQGNARKKKSGKVVSLSEVAEGSIVFQQGKPCSCQARRHRLVSNCLSCGKIVCEQEGEGPCNFCGALVLKEGSSYAGLSEGVVPLSDAEAAAEAYAKRLVEYDRNSAARTTVIDDQSDYYEIDGNSWLSKEVLVLSLQQVMSAKLPLDEGEVVRNYLKNMDDSAFSYVSLASCSEQEKELLEKKREEIEEAERAKRSRVVMTFDLVGRKVLLNEDEASEELQNRIMLQPPQEREATRIKPNPNLKVQPVFVDPGPMRAVKENLNKLLNNGICLEISGRIQHDNNGLTSL